MNNILIKRISLLALSALLVLCLFVVPTGATETEAENANVFDNAGMFTSAENAEIDESCKKIKAEHSLVVYIITSPIEYYGQSDFEGMISLNQNAIVLVISGIGTSNRYYDLYTFKEADSNITDKEIDAIIEVMRDDMVNGNYRSAVQSFLDASVKAYEGKYGVPVLGIIIVSISVSAVIGLITSLIVWGKYKMKIRPTNYPLDRFAKMKLTAKRDTLIRKFVTTRRIESNNSSSGGGSGGGGGGGSGSGHRGGSSF